MLIDEVVPRLRKAAPSVPKTGAEDDEEIAADMTAVAAKMMTSAEKAGKTFTPANIAFYACRTARVGRRSTGSGKTDVYSPGALVDGRVRHEALDDGLTCAALPDTEGPETLHDVVWGGGGPDPSEEAGRNLDWQEFLATRPRRQRVAILVLAQGGTMRETGRQCGIGDSAACLLRKQLAAAVLGFFGAETVARLLGGTRPQWESDLMAARERHACNVTADEHRPGFRAA